MMKFYEVDSPYYALLRAENEQQAKEKFVQHVGDDEGLLDGNIKEVSRDYALAKLAQAPGENKKLIPVNEVLNVFDCGLYEVLLIDGSLL